MKLKQIVEDSDTSLGKNFDLFIQFLIILSLISFSIETLPDLSKNTRFILKISEIVIVIIFSIEYLVRLFVADKKLKFIFSFYGLIDLFAILPFYIASGVDLRAIRIFRLFRLFRIFKIFRFSLYLILQTQLNHFIDSSLSIKIFIVKNFIQLRIFE
jgi:voltage-gated potassium channel